MKSACNIGGKIITTIATNTCLKPFKQQLKSREWPSRKNLLLIKGRVQINQNNLCQDTQDTKQMLLRNKDKVK